ncbi:ABC transporter substrate-binding protein [Pseudoclavibacter endophyticus]|uniref:Extracellular solute-binding protein n=1 Tax=Pseudoclavibacter endophyticus TaxID=1778590 RepID=A0A6H9WHC1_9MICO|nr:extracellular solute-binding protein [Pseudoclavibacter endophyticus]KAB1650312.1 extracellular solute-binding protein [Pseudoclavibacter endophyticus]GGA55227.1 ABC transporter substrate-binding protein [Pseudoclavibacter endophyticus]
MFRSNSRRALGGVSLAAAAALALTACGPAVGGDDAAADTADLSGVEPADSITFWTNHPGGSMDIEASLIESFTEETGIEVEHVTAGSNYEEVAQRFQNGQTSGDVGDVVVVSDATWFPAYLNGSLAPIDPLFEQAGADSATYQETLFNDYLYEGSHYAAPYARSTPIFYYNKDQYEAAGLEVAGPATWDDVKANSEALVAAGAADTGFVFPEESEYPAWTMANLVWGYGGAWSDEWDFSPLDGEGTVNALTFAQSAVTDGWAQVASGDPGTAFASGATSQVIASTGSLTTILENADFEVGVGFLPGGPEADTGIVPTGGAGLAVASASSPEKQVAAAMFVDFVTNAENTATYSAGTGYLPVRTDADMSDVYAETPAFEVAVQQLEATRSQDFARAFLPGGDLRLAQTLQQLLTGSDDVQTTLTSLREEFEGVYETDVAPELEG